MIINEVVVLHDDDYDLDLITYHVIFIFITIIYLLRYVVTSSSAPQIPLYKIYS
jgi:hypothetical protein